jgi:sugar phosphate permease
MKYQHRVVGMLSLLSIITYVDRVCIAVAGPRIQESLHISPEQWGWVTAVFFLSYSASRFLRAPWPTASARGAC